MVLKMKRWAPQLIAVLIVALAMSLYYNFSFMGGESDMISELKGAYNSMSELSLSNHEYIIDNLNYTCNTKNDSKILLGLNLANRLSSMDYNLHVLLINLYCDYLDDVNFDICNNESYRLSFSGRIDDVVRSLNTDLILKRINFTEAGVRACELLGYIEDNDYEAIREMTRSS